MNDRVSAVGDGGILMNQEAISDRIQARTTRRTVVKTGAKLAYAAPIVAASFRLTNLNAAAQVGSPVICENGGSCGNTTRCGPSCRCFTSVDRGGFCHRVQLCSSTTACTSSNQCAPGHICSTSTCCPSGGRCIQPCPAAGGFEDEAEIMAQLVAEAAAIGDTLSFSD